MTELGLFEAIDSLRSMRRLKPDPIPRAVLERILSAGTKAPSGMNSQPWAFVVVEDPARKRFLQERYLDGMRRRFVLTPPADDDRSPAARRTRAALHLAEHLHEAPVLLVVCGKRDWPAAVPPERRVGHAPPSYGSVYPCVQNILLACRGLGLGATLTTMHQFFEEELHAEFAIPDDYGVVVIIPIGYPLGRFGPLTRRPLSEIAYSDVWGRPWAAS